MMPNSLASAPRRVPVDDRSLAPAADGIDALSGRLIGHPASIALAVLCIGQWAFWAPNYMTWPMWADHDVFASAARAWDAGVLPYRDFRCNNFPGTIYAYRILGRLFPDRVAAAFFGFDAALVAGLGLLCAAWSRRVFGRMLPGLIGFALWQGYVQSLDYTQSAQRDWHAPGLMIAAILVAQAWRRRLALWASAGLAAAAFSIRPQVILLMPALLLAVGPGRRLDRRALGRFGEWGLAFGAFSTGLVLPLVQDGILDDFVRALRALRPGAGYASLGPMSFVSEFAQQLMPLRLVAVAAAVLLFWSGTGHAVRRIASVWCAAFAGILLYRPLSPTPHEYLMHPITLVACLGGAVVAAMILDHEGLRASLRLAVLCLVIGLGVAVKPAFCNPPGSLEAFRHLRKGAEPGPRPTGYFHNPRVAASGRYEWEDYRNLLAHLRALPAKTRVANALKYTPAINGPTGRLSPFPAESLAWLTVVKRDEEADFAKALRDATDSVVVWAPAELREPRLKPLPIITAAIRDCYERDRAFGDIEVWRRKRP